MSLDRRRFQELSAAALGGWMLGSLSGCGGNAQPVAKNESTAGGSGEKHLCRGLNECKGQGQSGKNDCRGQGDCATFAAHGCGGENQCKGQGGCGETAGINDCKGKGGCHVPLMDSAWKSVRGRLETKWNQANEKFSPAPEKKA